MIDTTCKLCQVVVLIGADKWRSAGLTGQIIFLLAADMVSDMVLFRPSFRATDTLKETLCNWIRSEVGPTHTTAPPHTFYWAGKCTKFRSGSYKLFQQVKAPLAPYSLHTCSPVRPTLLHPSYGKSPGLTGLSVRGKEAEVRQTEQLLSAVVVELSCVELWQ